MATESTKGHEKMSFYALILPCFSVDSVAIIAIFFRLKDYQEPAGICEVFTGSTSPIPIK
jgi:hypothetical protein